MMINLRKIHLKKARVNKEFSISGQNQENFVKQEKRDNFLSKSILPQKRMADESIVKSNETDSDDKPNPFAFLNRNKKSKFESSSKNNPFKLLKKTNDIPQVSEENPFKLSTGKKKRDDDDDVSNFSICKKKKEDNVKDRIFSSTVIDNEANKSANFSKISKINTTDTNTTWLSKKLIPSLGENIENNFDTEMQNFVDQFKDAVVVEVMSKLAIRTTIFRDEIDGDFSKGKNNFKRFKKVMPLRPQKTIITKDSFVALEPRDTTGIADSRREYHFSDDETDENKKD
ncbi:hypothetical protein NQ314_016174 [Rhamnusium bicolor]|uniref:Uncharacterized protein n=1 Tax=Rhamnusium bicolor TaxID=1586634 RepID=A0AAV8WWW6_9CUCU|nr:hypothetical protein NQ314_016174 [Rhamnusium bicolor]